MVFIKESLWGDMMKLTTEDIKRASKLAAKDYHTPKGWSDESWEATKLACRRVVDEYELNPVKNKVEISQAIKEAEKAVKKK